MKRAKLYGHLFIWLLILSFWQCSPYYYAPPLPNVPALREQGEGTFNIALSGQPESVGVEAKGAFSPTNNLVVAAEFAHLTGNVGKSKGNYFSLGAGYYNFMSRGYDDPRGWHLAALGGLGLGNAFNEYYTYHIFAPSPDDFAGDSYCHFLQGYVQPSGGWISPHFECIASMRTTWLHYDEISFHNVTTQERTHEYLLNNNHNQLLFEPGITLRLGWDIVKFQAQAATVFNAKVPVGELNIGVGMVIYPGR